MRTIAEGNTFLKVDLYNELRWLFVGAVTWQAAFEAVARGERELCPHQKVLGMDSALVHARALYEFYWNKTKGPDGARASDFAPSWTATSVLYSKYMANQMPSNKRVFHLVYNRSAHAGGKGSDGPDHIKNQVLEFARDLRRLTEEFIAWIQTAFRGEAGSALKRALNEAQSTAKQLGLANPL